MPATDSSKTKVKFEFDTSKMSPAQVRLLRSLNSIVKEVMVTKDEADFFDSSAEFMRLCASVIKQANFIEGQKMINDIPYSDQALEYSIEVLQEAIQNAKVVHYDN